MECGDLVGSIAEEFKRASFPTILNSERDFTRPFCQDHKQTSSSDCYNKIKKQTRYPKD
jgi:hypothetical protein